MSDLATRARGQLVTLTGQFTHPVWVEDVTEIGSGVYLLRIRHSDGRPDEAQAIEEELERALAQRPETDRTVTPEEFFLWVESRRIATAFAHDPLFAVSLSGVRGLPHQIESVYKCMLPQPRLRFVLADDPGAGKTIMAGLLLKELRLRGVVERCLVLAPAPLTMQWQDELFDKFDESFEIVASEQVRQLGRNPWERYPLVITSIDLAKREDIRSNLLRSRWDLVIVDEAHKCSAYTAADESIVKTKRYALAEGIAQQAERLLLLTATPHSGDEDRFTRFLALLEPDQFSNPDLVRKQIAAPNNPYFLRRVKEDLKDEHGADLFVKRVVKTQPFHLSPAEWELYNAVTRYVNTYLGAAGGGRAHAVALARTVLQRRLASSLGAIRSSLHKRAGRLAELADQLEDMPDAERVRRLGAQRRFTSDDAVVSDTEAGYEDIDERTEEALVTEVTAADQVAQLRAEIAELRRLVNHVDRVRGQDEERKLVALRECLRRAEFAELRDGRGRLLIFTEHRDTLDYLARHMRDEGYTVCTIHGGHPPVERKRIQHDFRVNKQICIATEAAGEGINLQFCHLMINYDLPWNPVRLEQRMGRIHRIGQSAECWVFNFCAQNTVEGKLLARLMEKLESMRVALQGRVYDVIGELLALNGIDFERLVRETLFNPTPARVDDALDQIARIDSQRLAEYEQLTGVALASRHVDLEWVRGQNILSEERRLMPEYVEAFFLRASEKVRLRVERRKDRLLRIEHVPVVLRSDDLDAVRRCGRPEPDYRKITFSKRQRDRSEHEDAVLCSPGHPLFAAVVEVLERDLRAAGVPHGTAAFVDPATSEPYHLHFFVCEAVGEDATGRPEPAFAELVAVLEDHDGLHHAPADILHTLTPAPDQQAQLPTQDQIRTAVNWVRVEVQQARTQAERRSRRDQAELRRRYLAEAMEAQRQHLENRWLAYDAKVAAGDDSYRLLRETTERQLGELRHRQAAKLAAFERLEVVRAGTVTHLGTASVLPPEHLRDAALEIWRPSREVEEAAVLVAVEFERADGWEPEYVGEARDGSGFDIRSKRRRPTGELDVRRIEVKGRGAPHGDVGLYRTEWYAAERWRSSFWLYVVYSAISDRPRLVRVQNPFDTLRGVEPVVQITGYRVPGASIARHM